LFRAKGLPNLYGLGAYSETSMRQAWKKAGFATELFMNSVAQIYWDAIFNCKPPNKDYICYFVAHGNG